MPPSLDIYVFSKSRDQSTLERFINTYVDREVSEMCGDEELMILPLEATKESSLTDEWDWEPAITLTHIVERGLDHPRRAFVVYLKPKDATVSGVTLAFTADNQIIFGLSIDDEGEKPENTNLAKRLLQNLAQSFNGHLGLITCEEPPPLWEEETQNMNRQFYIWKKEAGSKTM
jgi:hypothetical protein